ncbi:MAG: acetate kinase [Microcystaceae cyanobacterium]
MKVLILNAGSSSQKSCLYNLPEDTLPPHPPEAIWSATIDWTVADDYGLLKVKANESKQEIKLDPNNRTQANATLLNTLIEGYTKVIDQLSEINIVGHRVVHGGIHYSQSTLITPEVQQTIADLIPLAPTHNPAHLEGIEAITKILGDVPQMAVFDTAFHATMPPEVATYPIPYEWTEKGVRRYGFHGTSHKYCSQRVAELLGTSLEGVKLVTCHLGNGASLAAIKDGQSVNTTMGFTPLEGLMMGTRSGSVDPAILIYLMREHQLTADDLNNLLNKAAGLKGVSGLSADMRTIVQGVEDGNERAILAFEMYIQRLHANMGAMIATLKGLDILVFTAGVGENAAIVRERACQAFEFLGLKLDKEVNNQRPVDQLISTPDSQVKVYVIHTEEDWAIAKDCWHYLQDR